MSITRSRAISQRYAALYLARRESQRHCSGRLPAFQSTNKFHDSPLFSRNIRSLYGKGHCLSSPFYLFPLWCSCFRGLLRNLLVDWPAFQSDNKFLGEISEVACQSQNDVIFGKITQIDRHRHTRPMVRCLPFQ